MGVNTFTFDNETSSTYGVYITEGASYNAPERAVEMLEVPGRNGFYPMDLGRFNNVEVTYHCWVDGNTPADFKSKLSDLRNWLCSRVGYRRLEDSYNPSEYRMAIYKSGLEVTDPTTQSGEFDIVFDCKPQRFLTSGETAVEISSGSTLNNPTLFSAHPLLEVVGYGNINISGQTIVVHNEPIGDVVAWSGINKYNNVLTKTLPVYRTNYANVGDEIVYECFSSIMTWKIDSGTVTSGMVISDTYTPRMELWDATFQYGTASTVSDTRTVTLQSSKYGEISGSYSLSVAYDGSDEITITFSQTLPAHMSHVTGQYYNNFLKIQNGIIHSTQPLLGNPLYLDLDTGECYKIENDVPVSINNGIDMPAELPTLEAGDNVITFDNTTTSLKLIPRWWKV